MAKTYLGKNYGNFKDLLDDCAKSRIHSTDMEDCNNLADLVARESNESLKELWMAEKNEGRAELFYKLLNSIWAPGTFMRWYNTMVSPLLDVMEEALDAHNEKVAELTKSLEKQSIEIADLKREMNKRIGEKEQTIIELKAKLYDLLETQAESGSKSEVEDEFYNGKG